MKNKKFLNSFVAKVSCLVIGALLAGFLIPFGNVFAESTGVSTPEELLSYFESGGDIKLLNDITLDANALVSSDLTLDLNGYTLDMSDKTLMPTGASLTLEDHSVANTGSVTSTADFTIQFGSSTTSGGLILNSGTINCQGAYGVRNFGDLEINGGIISGKTYVVYNQTDSLVMNGGLVIATEENAVANGAEGASFILNGGTVKTLGDDVAVRLNSPFTSFVMNGGRVEALYQNVGTEEGAGRLQGLRYEDGGHGHDIDAQP
jgi:hypothetical protein